MGDLLGAVLGWLVPAVTVFGVAAIAVAAIVWAVRRAARGPRALAAADARRTTAGVRLVALDDLVDELDLEVGLSGALYGGDAPASLRRSRMTAQHTRDQLFEEYREVMASTAPPREIAHAADRITARADRTIATIEAARREHAAWVRANVSAAQQVAAARTRLETLRTSMGDPAALVADLEARFDPEEWADAAASAQAAVAHVEQARDLLDDAEARTHDPSQSALGPLAAAERELRAAQESARALEESHRLLLQAAAAVSSEIDVARTAIRQSLTTRESLEPDAAERLGAAIRDAQAGLAEAEQLAARRPIAAVDRIARLRDRLDLALGDARTAQQRMRGARSALPGTLAAARAAVAHAEASTERSRAGAEARVRLASAQRELAAARQAADPVEALDAARRAMRHAEDAQALADYDRLTGSGGAGR